MPVLVSGGDKQYLYHACNQTALGCEWHAYAFPRQSRMSLRVKSYFYSIDTCHLHRRAAWLRMHA